MTNRVDYFSFYGYGLFTDKNAMKILLLLFNLTCLSALAVTGVRGKVASPKDCSRDVMVWLSLDKEEYKERLLLMHTEVPVGGRFQFYLKPGDYQLRASDKIGCEFFQKISVTTKVTDIEVKMVKK